MIREPLCDGRSCLVVGSAPGVRAELTGIERDRDWVVLGANGGAAIARAAGLPVHVLATTAYLFRDDNTRAERETAESLAGLTVETIYLDEKHGSVSEVMPRLEGLGIEYERLVRVAPEARSEVSLAACGLDERISTGVWAACLAVASGASEVWLAGISLDAGHEGMPWDTASRDHVAEDARTLAAMECVGLGCLGVAV